MAMPTASAKSGLPGKPPVRPSGPPAGSRKEQLRYAPATSAGHNLTIRALMKRFARLSLGFSTRLENLEAACRDVSGLLQLRLADRVPEEERNRLPAAMMAGVVDRLMSFEDLFDAVIGRDRR